MKEHVKDEEIKPSVSYCTQADRDGLAITKIGIYGCDDKEGNLPEKIPYEEGEGIRTHPKTEEKVRELVSEAYEMDELELNQYRPDTVFNVETGKFIGKADIGPGDIEYIDCIYRRGGEKLNIEGVVFGEKGKLARVERSMSYLEGNGPHNYDETLNDAREIIAEEFEVHISAINIHQ